MFLLDILESIRKMHDFWPFLGILADLIIDNYYRLGLETGSTHALLCMDFRAANPCCALGVNSSRIVEEVWPFYSRTRRKVSQSMPEFMLVGEH